MYTTHITLHIMNRVGYLHDPKFQLHDSTITHCECPGRTFSINQSVINTHFFDYLIKISSRTATIQELYLAHNAKYVESIIEKLNGHHHAINQNNSDMYANKNTLSTALLAAGSALQLIDAILDNHIQSGFANLRPPGHHATSSKCGGFCFFNNVAIAAIHAAKLGRKVLIVDWDVHHGDGTKDILDVKIKREHPDVYKNIFFFSIHRWDSGSFYPCTGKPYTKNNGISIGFTGSKKDKYYIKKFTEVLVPAAKTFNPDLIIVSAGFDAAKGDPLGACEVTPDGYKQLTKILMTICPRIALILEGGYNLQSTSTSVVACMEALCDE